VPQNHEAENSSILRGLPIIIRHSLLHQSITTTTTDITDHVSDLQLQLSCNMEFNS